MKTKLKSNGKWVLVIISALLFAMVFFGCEGAGKETNSNMLQKDKTGENDPPVDIDPGVLINISAEDVINYEISRFDSIYKLSPHPASGVYYNQFLLKSEAEKDAWFFPLYELNKEIWDLELTHFGRANHAVLLMDSYDDNFFKESNLLIIPCSRSNSLFLTGAIRAKNNELNVQMYNSPLTAVGAVLSSCFYIPIRKDCFDGETINVEFINVASFEEWDVLKGAKQ